MSLTQTSDIELLELPCCHCKVGSDHTVVQDLGYLERCGASKLILAYSSRK